MLGSWVMRQQWYVAPPDVKRLEEPESPELSWANVEVAALMLLFNVGISTWLGLGLSAGLVIASIRCVIQLTVLGLILNQIFLTQNPVYIFGMTLVLGLLASTEVTYWRAKRTFPGMFAGTLVAITGSAMAVALFGNAYSLNMAPVYTAQKFIPTIGMLFGNCMIGMSIGMTSVMDSLDTHRDRTETMLCYGAARWETIRPVARDALRAAMLPTITNMSITGLISIPGVMTGWILGGANVLQAARYQQIILFMITAASASSSLLAVLFSASVLVDKTPSLRLDRITLCNTLKPPSRDDKRKGLVSSRTTLRHRSRGRLLLPKTELYSSAPLSRTHSSTASSSSPTISTECRTQSATIRPPSSLSDADSAEEPRTTSKTPLLMTTTTGSLRRVNDQQPPVVMDIEEAAASVRLCSRRRCNEALAKKQNRLSVWKIRRLWEGEVESAVACALCPFRKNPDQQQNSDQNTSQFRSADLFP
ncbi:hypothetical protein EV175_001091 [Coemansia sp. RSA 1933]|nr:hypothetical protein EV175_001091 [Coemansia sp. RSA 1933]